MSAKPFIFEQLIFEQSIFEQSIFPAVPPGVLPTHPIKPPVSPRPADRSRSHLIPRRPVQIAASPHELLVFGGNGGDGLLNDAWLFDLRASQWVLTDARRRRAGMGGGGEAVPEGREWHALHRSVLWPDHTAVRAAATASSGQKLTPAASAPGLGLPPCHICTGTAAHPCHICAGSGLALPMAVPEVGSPLDHICTGTGLALRARSACTRTRAYSCVHICAGTELGSHPCCHVVAAPKRGLTPDHVRAGTKCAHPYCLTWAPAGFQVLFGGVGALERPLHDLWTFDMRACAWAREPPPSGELPPVRTQRAP